MKFRFIRILALSTLSCGALHCSGEDDTSGAGGSSGASGSAGSNASGGSGGAGGASGGTGGASGGAGGASGGTGGASGGTGGASGGAGGASGGAGGASGGAGGASGGAGGSGGVGGAAGGAGGASGGAGGASGGAGGASGGAGGASGGSAGATASGGSAGATASGGSAGATASGGVGGGSGGAGGSGGTPATGGTAGATGGTAGAGATGGATGGTAGGTSSGGTAGTGGDAGVGVVVFNEVESNGGTPGDWAELYNSGSAAIDLSGWIFRDSDDSHTYTLPAGTLLAPGAYLLLEEAAFGFGLGASDAVRLFDPSDQLVTSYAWTAHAAVTLQRCPNGSGPFAASTTSSKGASNACGSSDPDGGTEGGSDGGLGSGSWPGTQAVSTADGSGVFGGNLSGLVYQPGAPSVLWAVRNGPPALYRLIANGTTFAPDTSGGWSAGKALQYASGTGAPDSEGVTFAEWGTPVVYVATERDNNASGTSKLAILSFDVTSSATALAATREWNLTSDLPAVGANLGLEGITWIPDTFLVAEGLRDERLSKTYAPADYPGHGTGLFLVGVEASGMVYAYALDQGGTSYQRVASFSSGHPGVMDLSFDRETGYLWAQCDDTCGNVANVLVIDGATGAFHVRASFTRPSDLPNLNNEGIALAPEAECAGGQKSWFWTDDGETGGHSVRRASIPCGSFLP